LKANTGWVICSWEREWMGVKSAGGVPRVARTAGVLTGGHGPPLTALLAARGIMIPLPLFWVVSHIGAAGNYSVTNGFDFYYSSVEMPPVA
jgi:hypothetical protein